MREYIDLVFCKSLTGETEVFQAPAFTHLKEGDMVIAESGDGETMTNVVTSIEVGTDSDELEFILKLIDVGSYEELTKIKSKVIYRNLEYKED